MSRAVFTRLVGAIAILVGARTNAGAQGWSADVSAGRLVYNPASVNVTSNNLMGTLRADTRRDGWVYGSLAAPFSGGDTFWGAAGAGGRFTAQRAERRPVSVGANLAAQGFSFRDAVTLQTGSGGTVDAMPYLQFAAGAASAELSGGWRGYTLSQAGARDSRGVFETGARAGYGTGLRVEGIARVVRATEGTYPFAGTTLAYDRAPARLWGQAGKWLHDNLNDVTWAVGADVKLGRRATLWASVREEASDPLYWNTSRRSWIVGVTRRLGRVPSPLQPAPRSQGGQVVVRLRASDTPAGAVAIAGDFNNWQPAPMQREGNAWILRLPLAPGVYHYAFRSATGTWFVPESTAGRQHDGMGGHVAVLVVN